MRLPKGATKQLNIPEEIRFLAALLDCPKAGEVLAAGCASVTDAQTRLEAAARHAGSFERVEKPASTADHRVTATYLGCPDVAARIAVCGRVASIENDRQIIAICAPMSSAFAIWLLFEGIGSEEARVRTLALN